MLQFTSTNRSSRVLCLSGAVADDGFCNNCKFPRACNTPDPVTFRDGGLGDFFLKFS